MALYQDGILISGANTLPKMTLADYKAMPVDQRPTYWERLDADYDDVLAPKTDIATVESGSTASRAYSVGELVYVSGTLYRVKTAIASGATFTVGTNVEVTNVSNVIPPNTIETGTIRVLNSAITIGASSCKKVGKCVTVSAIFGCSEVLSSGAILQLPWTPISRVDPVIIGTSSNCILYSSSKTLNINVGQLDTSIGHVLNFSYFTDD